MRKIAAFLFLNLSFSFAILTAQSPEIDWQKNFGGSDEDSGYTILATSDNYLLVGGSTSSTDGDITENLGGYDAWIVKYDLNGNEIWKKAYGGSDWDVIWDIKETFDGNYIFFGISASTDGDAENNLGETDFWVVKLNPNGDIIWKKNYGGSGLEDDGEILTTSDNGFVLIGSSSSSDGNFSNNNGDLDYAVIKINSSGEVQWSKLFGGSGLDMALNGMVDQTGNILLTGYGDSNDGDFIGNKGSSDVWVLKLSPDGNLIWKKNIGGSDYEQSYCIKQLLNGNYLVGINSRSQDVAFDSNFGNMDIWLFEMDANGSILTKRHFGGQLSDIPMEFDELPNNDLIIGGTTYSSDGDIFQNYGSGDFWMLKINPLGEILWEKNYGGSDLDRMWGMTKIEGGYAAIGESKSNDMDLTDNHGNFDFWVLKLNPEIMGTNEPLYSDFNIYPNPASNKIYFQSKNQIESIEIFDLEGKLIYKNKLNLESNELDISNLISGTYILKITSKGQSLTKKIVKL